MPFMRKVERAFDHLIGLMALVGGTLALAVMLMVCYLVVMRYLFSKPPAWIIEVSEYFLFYITFFSSAWLLKHNGHVSVDLVVQALPPGMRQALHIFTSAVGAVSCFILFLAGLWVTWDNYSRGINSIQTIAVPKWILLGAIPLGGSLLTIQFIRQFLVALKDFGRPAD